MKRNAYISIAAAWVSGVDFWGALSASRLAWNVALVVIGTLLLAAAIINMRWVLARLPKVAASIPSATQPQPAQPGQGA